MLSKKKERLQKDAFERHQNLSEEEKEKKRQSYCERSKNLSDTIRVQKKLFFNTK